MATKTIYSNRGTRREVPEKDYGKFKEEGWHDTNPLDTPEEIPSPVEVPETPEIETPIETPIVPEAITPEQLTPVELPEVGEPYQPIQDVFGAEWKPAPVFEQLGLTEQGIYGAVRVKGMDDVYTIGEGGRKETAESYLERFGTAEQAGIVGEVSMEEAKKLGINVETETLMSDVTEEIPESFTAEMTPEQKAQVGIDILAASEVKYGIEGLKKEKDDAITSLINTIKGIWEKFEVAKEEKEEKLEMEEKNKAISDAQTSYTKVKSVYDKYINELTHSTMTTAHIGGLQAKARSQMAVELAPLSSAIQIAQGNWDRAKEILDDFSDDWKQAQEWNLQAAQMKIDMLGENLTEAQEKSRFEAQNKLDWAREDYNRILSTQDEVKKLSLMYPEANISIADDWETAYKKISPFIKNEKDFEQKIKDLELKIAQKAYDKPYYAPTKTTDDEKIVKWSQEIEDAGLAGKPQWLVDDIFNLTSPPDWFNESMEAEYQMSKDWQDEWTEERNKVIKVFSKAEDEDEFSFSAITKGARNAGMSVEEFKKLSIDEQNSWMEEF